MTYSNRDRAELEQDGWVLTENDRLPMQTSKTGFTAFARETAASVKSHFLDKPLKNNIDVVSDYASALVAEKIKHVLYGDPERYGVVRGRNGTPSQHVDIYYKNSPVLNKLMKSATGYSIDDVINSLPIGAKQLAAPLRTYLENMVANMLTEQLSKLSVKKATTAALLAASHYTQDQISQYMREQFSRESVDPAIMKLLDKAPDVKAAQERAKRPVDDSILDTDSTGTTLRDVVNFYKAQIQFKLNHSLRQALVEGIAEAAEMVGTEATERGINYARAAAGTIGIGAGCTGAIPAMALGFGAALALEPTIAPAKNYVSAKAKDAAQRAANYYLPTDLIPVDYNALGKASYETIQDDTGFDFELMKITQPTFTKWAEEKYQAAKTALTDTLNDLRRRFTSNQDQSSKIPEVMQNWFRDNDFPKLKKIRDAYVESERKLNSLDLELMNICEYAYGIREEVNGQFVDNRKHGLEMCQQQLQAILEKIEEAKSAPQLTVESNRNVDNAKRRQELIKGADARIDSLYQDMSSYVAKVKSAIKEAQNQLEEETAVSSAKSKPNMTNRM